MKNYLRQVYRRCLHSIFKNKEYQSEDDFYNFFFTKHSSWSSFEPNEDEQVRLQEIIQFIENSSLKKNINILDVGCGRGWLSNKLRKYGKITGIDPVKSVIKFAKKQYKGIDFSANTPDKYLEENPAKKFDLIVSSEVLEHVIDKKSFLTTINNLLKEEGTLILTTPRQEKFNMFTEIYGTKTYQPVEEWVSEKEIRTLFEQTNFFILDYKFFSPLPGPITGNYIYQIWLCKKNAS